MEINLITAIITIINFLVMMTVIKYFFYKPIVQMFDNRKNAIKTQLDEAEKERLEADRLRNEYEMSIANVQKEANLIIEDARKLGDEKREEILSNAKEEAQKLSFKAKKEIQKDKEEAIKELHNQVADIALSAAEKILGRNVTISDHETMLDNLIEEVGRDREY